MNYQANHPYPVPRVEKPNKEYAYILLQSYAGEVSEDTAIHLYLYQFLTQNQKDKDLASALHHIAIVEMHHLQLLGETIQLLGIDPVFKTKDPLKSTMIPWNATYVNYETKIKQLLEIDIASEQTAIRNYTLQKEIIEDKYIQNLITRIIEDEKIHLQIFHHFYQLYKASS